MHTYTSIIDLDWRGWMDGSMEAFTHTYTHSTPPPFHLPFLPYSRLVLVSICYFHQAGTRWDGLGLGRTGKDRAAQGRHLFKFTCLFTCLLLPSLPGSPLDRQVGWVELGWLVAHGEG